MQITYKDKVTLQSNPNIPDENKVTAKDMNEIKSAVNSNEEEQQALNMSVQEIAQNVVNNSQEISNIKEEQTTQNENIQTNSNNISDLQSNKADKSEIPTDLSQLSNENTKFVNETELENAISQEKTQRQNADNNLQNQIDAITASTDVIDIVGTYQDLQDYDTSKVKQNDVIKVLQDSTHNNAMSYYRWQNQWIYIGSEGPYYTIGQTDKLLQGKANQSDLNQTNTNVTKLAGRVSNNERKIENIEQEQTEQNKNISTNVTNIESLQEENDKLKKIVSQLPQVTGQGTEVTLENTIEATFTKFDVEGNSVQDGSPSPDNEVPIKSAGDNGSINEKIQNKNLLVEDINYVSTYHDSKTYLDLYIILGTATNLQAKFIYQSRIDNKGRINATFTAQDDYTRFIIKHNGSTTDLSKIYNFSFKKDVEYTLSLNLTGINPTVDGGFSYNEVMIVEGTSTDYVPHEEQDYPIPVQQPMRSIGDVRDCFVKKSNGKLYERHLPYIASYNGETLPQDVYNEVDNVKYCNEKSMSTTGQFSIGASVQYIDENNWNDLPCTSEQVEQLENKPSTYKDFTIIQSQDETEAYLEVSGIRDINTMFDKVTNAIVSLGGNV